MRTIKVVHIFANRLLRQIESWLSSCRSMIISHGEYFVWYVLEYLGWLMIISQSVDGDLTKPAPISNHSSYQRQCESRTRHRASAKTTVTAEIATCHCRSLIRPALVDLRIVDALCASNCNTRPERCHVNNIEQHRTTSNSDDYETKDALRANTSKCSSRVQEMGRDRHVHDRLVAPKAESAISNRFMKAEGEDDRPDHLGKYSGQHTLLARGTMEE